MEQIIRIGMYDYPRRHDTLGDLSPTPLNIATAQSHRSGDRIAATGAAAANRLGVSTQVPAKVGFATTGRSRVLHAGGRNVTLRHSRAPVLDKVPDAVNTTIQLLAYLGRDKVDTDLIDTLASRLDDAAIKALLGARGDMPGWMGDVVLKFDRARNG